MSPRDWRTRINDIITCIQNTRSFTQNMDMDTFINDPKTVRACAFELSVMGEAVRALPEEIRQQYKQIPWNKIQGMRNKIIHEYYRIDEEILWQTITNDLPPFISMLEKIVKE